MEWWNNGILVFKRILAILILSSIPPIAGPFIQHCIIPEPIIPIFQHSSSYPVCFRFDGHDIGFVEGSFGGDT
jgi:hypothetical protein